jgi:hypothetical protein
LKESDTMKKFISGLTASAAILGAFGATAFAGPSPSPSPAAKAPATLACPACKMPMPTKKTGIYTVPEKINGKTYYCCSACPIGKAGAKKAAAAKPAAK